jgi:phosphoenolpyruvate carboxylase
VGAHLTQAATGLILAQQSPLEKDALLARSICNRFLSQPLSHTQIELLKRYPAGDAMKMSSSGSI